MIEIKFIRQNVELLQESLRKRGQEYDLRPFLDSDSRRRAILLEAEELKHKRNTVSGRIAQMNKEQEDPSKLIAQMRAVSQKIKALDEELSKHEQTLRAILLEIPNIPDSSVPVGKDEEDNVVVEKVGEEPLLCPRQRVWHVRTGRLSCPWSGAGQGHIGMRVECAKR